MRNCCRKLLLIIQIVLIPALLLSGCADLKISKALVQHAVGGIYDPTDQIAVEQLNAILDAVVAQDAAAIKAQFAPNAVAAQPELDDQIETLLGYYSEDNGVIKDTSRRSGSSANGAGTKSSYYIIRGRMLLPRFCSADLGHGVRFPKVSQWSSRNICCPRSAGPCSLLWECPCWYLL